MIEVDRYLVATHTTSETVREVWRFRIVWAGGMPQSLVLSSKETQRRATTRHKWRADERTSWCSYERRGLEKPTPSVEVINAVRRRLVIDCENLAYEA